MFTTLCLSALAIGAIAGPTKVDLPIITSDGYSLIEVNVGNPATTVRLLFDTGSSSIWIDGANCNSTSCPNASNYTRAGYNVSESRTGQYTGGSATIDYLGGVVSGPIVTDIVDFGGLINVNSTFIDVNQSSWAALPADGFIGLAFDTITPPGVKSIMSTLLQDDVLEKPMFSVYYPQEDKDTNTTTDGVFTLGGSDISKYATGPIGDIPIVKQDNNGTEEFELWTSSMQQLRITSGPEGNQTTERLSYLGISRTVFDTGANFIGLADVSLDSVYAALGWNYTAILNNEEILYCSYFNSSWSVDFVFGYGDNQTVTLYGDQLAIPGFPIAPGACFPPFSSTGGSYNLFGPLFLKNFYSVFDFGGYNYSDYQPSLLLGSLREQ